MALIKSRCEEINQEAHRIQQDVQQLIESTRQRYHSQTKHGSNHSVQQAWEAQIKSVKLRSDGVLADLPK
jgi:NADH:ubiquinone oxidoreductase subunit D